VVAKVPASEFTPRLSSTINKQFDSNFHRFDFQRVSRPDLTSAAFSRFIPAAFARFIPRDKHFHVAGFQIHVVRVVTLSVHGKSMPMSDSACQSNSQSPGLHGKALWHIP